MGASMRVLASPELLTTRWSPKQLIPTRLIQLQEPAHIDPGRHLQGREFKQRAKELIERERAVAARRRILDRLDT
jgi:hypothetical protein